MEEKINYQEDIEIDNSALDVEWLRQASLTFKFCKIEANIKREIDIKEVVLGLIRADLDKQIRMNPEEFEITTKLTETVINNTILEDDEYKRCFRVLLEQKYELAVAKAAVKSIDSKKTALESLVKLHGQQYFAGPSVPRDLSKEWEAKEQQEKINQKIQIKKRTRKPHDK